MRGEKSFWLLGQEIKSPGFIWVREFLESQGFGNSFFQKQKVWESQGIYQFLLESHGKSFIQGVFHVNKFVLRPTLYSWHSDQLCNSFNQHAFYVSFSSHVINESWKFAFFYPGKSWKVMEFWKCMSVWTLCNFECCPKKNRDIHCKGCPGAQKKSPNTAQDQSTKVYGCFPQLPDWWYSENSPCEFFPCHCSLSIKKLYLQE